MFYVNVKYNFETSYYIKKPHQFKNKLMNELVYFILKHCITLMLLKKENEKKKN